MIDYRKMYHILCRAASAALDKLPDTGENAEGREFLSAALLEAEEIYLSSREDDEEMM